MTKDLKDLVDNIHQLAMNSRDISAVSRMVGTIHAVDEALLVLTKERDEARREVCYCQHDSAQFAINRGWDCFKEETL
jgi:deoxycytidylate deaminase